MSRFLAVVGITAIMACAASPVQAECGRTGVHVFSAYWCPVCRATERFLDDNQISYRRIETANNPDVRAYMEENFGTTAVPVVVVDGEYQIGFDQEWLRLMLCLD